jgi:hypothetical protein
MIGFPIPALFTSALLIIFVLLIVKGLAAARDVSSTSNDLLDDAAEIPPCPPEFVFRVFSSGDARFVSGTQSHQLVKLFRSERKEVALLWVRQVSAGIQRTIRDHTRMARSSEGLDFITEVKLLFLYGELMLFCGALFVAIQSAGPAWLGRVAVYLDAQSQRLARTQQAVRAATTPREFPRVGAA